MKTKVTAVDQTVDVYPKLMKDGKEGPICLISEATETVNQYEDSDNAEEPVMKIVDVPGYRITYLETQEQFPELGISYFSEKIDKRRFKDCPSQMSITLINE